MSSHCIAAGCPIIVAAAENRLLPDKAPGGVPDLVSARAVADIKQPLAVCAVSSIKNDEQNNKCSSYHSDPCGKPTVSCGLPAGFFPEDKNQADYQGIKRASAAQGEGGVGAEYERRRSREPPFPPQHERRPAQCAGYHGECDGVPVDLHTEVIYMLISARVKQGWVAVKHHDGADAAGRGGRRIHKLYLALVPRPAGGQYEKQTEKLHADDGLKRARRDGKGEKDDDIVGEVYQHPFLRAESVSAAA